MKSKSAFLLTAELILLSLTLILAGAWILYPGRNFEPYAVICGVVFSAIEIRRRHMNRADTQSHKHISGNIGTLGQAACRIAELLHENRRVFNAYGPNSSASSVEPLRTDMTLWERAKNDQILPNNREIEGLIRRFLDVVPLTKKASFEEMLSHIYAFEKHCEDPSFDYSNNRFPRLFPVVIEALCSENGGPKSVSVL